MIILFGRNMFISVSAFFFNFSILYNLCWLCYCSVSSLFFSCFPVRDVVVPAIIFKSWTLAMDDLTFNQLPHLLSSSFSRFSSVDWSPVISSPGYPEFPVMQDSIFALTIFPGNPRDKVGPSEPKEGNFSSNLVPGVWGEAKSKHRLAQTYGGTQRFEPRWVLCGQICRIC